MRGIPRTTTHSLHLPKTPSLYQLFPPRCSLFSLLSAVDRVTYATRLRVEHITFTCPQNCSWDQRILLCSNPLFLPPDRKHATSPHLPYENLPIFGSTISRGSHKAQHFRPVRCFRQVPLPLCGLLTPWAEMTADSASATYCLPQLRRQDPSPRGQGDLP